MSSSEHLYKSSSTAMLAITFILFTAYSVLKIIANRKTQFGKNVSSDLIHILMQKQAEVPRIILNFIRVIEIDLSPSFLIYFVLIGLGQFYAAAAVFAYLTLLAGAVLVLAYQKYLHKLKIIARVFLVLFTLAAFINCFADDMTFDDIDSESLNYFITQNGG